MDGFLKGRQRQAKHQPYTHIIMKAKLLTTFAVAGVSLGLIQGAGAASIVVAAFYNFGYTTNPENYPPNAVSANHPANPNYFESGFSGGVVKAKASWDIGGSSDVDLGDLDTSVFTVPQVQGGDGHLRVGQDGTGHMAGASVVRVTNSSGMPWELDTLYFDAAADIEEQEVLVWTSPDSVNWSFLFGTSVLGPLTFVDSGGVGDFGDYNADLGMMTLADGASIYFKFALNTSNTARIDNIGVTAIPEPGSLLVFGSMLGAALVFRRRQRSA